VRRPWKVAQESLKHWCELGGPSALARLVHPKLPIPILDMSLYLIQRFVLMAHGKSGEAPELWTPLLELIQVWISLVRGFKNNEYVLKYLIVFA
jgi:hypothetical protein